MATRKHDPHDLLNKVLEEIRSDPEVVSYLRRAFRITDTVVQCSLDANLASDTFVAALSLTLDTPYVCLRNRDRVISAAVLWSGDLDERDAVLRMCPLTEEDRRLMLIASIDRRARDDIAGNYERVLKSLQDPQLEQRTRDELVENVCIRDSRLLNLNEFYSIPVWENRVLELGRPDRAGSDLVGRAWRLLAESSRQKLAPHTSRLGNLVRAFLLLTIPSSRRGSKSPRTRRRQLEMEDSPARGRHLQLIQQKVAAWQAAESAGRTIRETIMREFGALDSFARSVGDRLAKPLEDLGWKPAVGYDNRWIEPQSGTKQITLTLVVGEPWQDEIRQSYWFSASSAGQLFEVLSRTNQAGAETNGGFRDLWLTGFETDRSVIGYTSRTRTPLFLHESRSDIRRYSYQSAIEQIESEAFGEFDCILQLPVLIKSFRPSVRHEDETVSSPQSGRSNYYAACTVVLLSTAPINSKLALELWGQARQLQQEAESAFNHQAEVGDREEALSKATGWDERLKSLVQRMPDVMRGALARGDRVGHDPNESVWKAWMSSGEGGKFSIFAHEARFNFSTKTLPDLLSRERLKTYAKHFGGDEAGSSIASVLGLLLEACKHPIGWRCSPKVNLKVKGDYFSEPDEYHLVKEPSDIVSLFDMGGDEEKVKSQLARTVGSLTPDLEPTLVSAIVALAGGINLELDVELALDGEGLLIVSGRGKLKDSQAWLPYVAHKNLKRKSRGEILDLLIKLERCVQVYQLNAMPMALATLGEEPNFHSAMKLAVPTEMKTENIESPHLKSWYRTLGDQAECRLVFEID